MIISLGMTVSAVNFSSETGGNSDAFIVCSNAMSVRACILAGEIIISLALRSVAKATESRRLGC